MKVTSVIIRKRMHTGRVRAIVSVTLNDFITIHEIKVIEVNEKTFIGMPSISMGNGQFRDIVHPISAQAREIIEQAVLEEYNKNEESHA